MFHIIAERKSHRCFDAIVAKSGIKIPETKIKRYLNQGIGNKVWLSPLFFIPGDVSLAKKFLKHGASGEQLRLPEVYDKYKRQVDYLDFAIAQFHMNI